MMAALVSPVLAMIDIPGQIKGMRRRAKESTLPTMPRHQGQLLLYLWEPREFDIPLRYANALKTFISCACYQTLVPLALPAGVVGIFMQYWIDKYMLLRVMRRPTVPQGSNLVQTSLFLSRIFISIGVPVGLVIFLTPSASDDSVMVSFCFLGILLAVAGFLIPDAIQRLLICTYCCLGKTAFDEDQDAAGTDYYEAQHVWPANMKYHKTHMLYKMLPEKANPENLTPGDWVKTDRDAAGKVYCLATEAQMSENENPACPISNATGWGKVAGGLKKMTIINHPPKPRETMGVSSRQIDTE